MPDPSPKYLFGGNQRVLVDDLIPMQTLIRLSRDDEEYIALYQDIEKRGQKVAIKARPHPNPELRAHGKLEVLDGMGRLQVCKELNFYEMRADVEDLTDEEAYEMAFVLNLNRENLNALSIATWLDFMSKRFNLTQSQLGARVARSQQWVSRYMLMLPKRDDSGEPFDFSAAPQPQTERQARALRTAPPPIRQRALDISLGTGELPSGREIERMSRAEFTPEQVLVRYARPGVTDEFLEYMLQEDAGLTLTQAKQAVRDYRIPKRSSGGTKFNPDTPNVWTKLSQYYPTEIIDVISNLTGSEHFDTLIKHCRRYSQRLYLKAPESLRQAVMDEWAS